MKFYTFKHCYHKSLPRTIWQALFNEYRTSGDPGSMDNMLIDLKSCEVVIDTVLSTGSPRFAAWAFCDHGITDFYHDDVFIRACWSTSDHCYLIKVSTEGLWIVDIKELEEVTQDAFQRKIDAGTDAVPVNSY